MRPSPTGLTEGPFLPKARNDTERLDMCIIDPYRGVVSKCRVRTPFYKDIRELGTSMLRSTQSLRGNGEMDPRLEGDR